MRTITIQKTKQKNKRYKVTMEGFPNMDSHSHTFGSSTGKTYVDGATDQQKSAWYARHSVNKNFDSMHSPVFYSKSLLWNTNNLKKNIELLAKKLNSRIVVKGKL